MAKHIKNTNASAKQSQGKRISCHGNKKAITKAMAGNNNNAIREAFFNADFPDSVRFSRLGQIAIKAIQAPVKQTADQIRGWSANLSYKTYSTLKQQRILA